MFSCLISLLRKVYGLGWERSAQSSFYNLIARVERGEEAAQGEMSGEKAREEVCRRLGKSQGMTCGKNASSFEEVF